MTDLSKGIIEIDGIEINACTSPEEINNRLSSRYVSHLVSPSGKSESFSFHGVLVNNRLFSIELYFYFGQLESIRLDYMNEECYSFKQRFEQDCLWLKSALGKPSCEGKFGIVYKYPGHRIGVTYQLNDGRCGTDEFIDVTYERG